MKKAQAIVVQQCIMHIAGHICEGQALDARGHDVRVTIIQGGKSVNGYYYDEQALQQIARMVEGARAYADHGRSEADQQTRSVRDMVGFYRDAQHFPPTAGSPHGRVDATLHILEAAAWLWSIIQEAVALEKPDLIGLSIDIFGNWQQSEERQVKQVTRVLSLNSCDVVTRPSAGGSFQRILHSHETQGEPHMMTSESLEQAADEQAQSGTVSSPASPTPSPTPASSATSQADTTEQSRVMEAQQAAIQTALTEIQREKCALLLERRLMESQLPEAAQQHLRQQFGGRVFESGELDAGIGNLRSMLAGLRASGLITGNGYEKPATGHMISEAEKIQAAFDGMFDLDIDTARLGNVRAFGSIREAYARVTGDASVAGFSDRSTLGHIRVSENAPMGRFSEADTTTASFSYLLGTSMNKRLLKDYQAWPAEWQKFCTVAPIKDFKQQTRVRLGAFGSLSTVAEDTAYSTISLTDTAATYVPTKRGNLVTAKFHNCPLSKNARPYTANPLLRSGRTLQPLRLHLYFPLAVPLGVSLCL